MSVTVDAVTNGVFTNGTTVTFAHTVSGADRELQVSVHVHTQPVTSVTYNGVSLSLLRQEVESSQGTNTEVWHLIAPPTGTHNVVVVIANSNNFGVVAISLNGVNQTSPTGTIVSGNYPGSGISESLITSGQVNGLVLDFFTLQYGAGTITPNGGQTTQTGPTTNSNDLQMIVTSKAGAASVTTGFSWVNDFYRWSHIAVPIYPVSAGGLSERMTRGSFRGVAR